MTHKKSKGFTILELVTAIAVLSIAVALTVTLVVSLNNIQRTTTEQFLIDEDLNKVNDVTKEYVNFVSLHNDEVSFEYVPSTSSSSSITFSCDGYNYVLSYADSSIKITNNYDGTDDYFKKTRTDTIDKISNITFTYNVDLALLNLKVTVGDRESHMDYIVRTLR